MVEDLRDPVVGEHSQLVNVVEAPPALPLELGVDVADQDLRAFVEVHLMPPVQRVVLEVGEVAGQDAEQLHSRVVGPRQQTTEGAIELVHNHSGHLPEYPGPLIGQGYLHAAEDLLHQFLLSNFPDMRQGMLLLYELFHTGGQVLVLEALQRPETEIQTVQSKQIQQCLLDLVLTRLQIVMLELVEGRVMEPIGQGCQFLLVEVCVVCLLEDPVAGLPDQLALVDGHL